MKISSCANSRTQVYYLPIWFQVIKDDSAVKSGIHLLTQVLALIVASILTGVLTSRAGYYTPFLILGICVIAVDVGLLTTFRINATVG